MKAFIHESGILASLEGPEADNNEADVNLLRLPAPNLKGTWKKAYELLARLVSQIGWDELLKARSEVFVMEEEYRMQKQEQEQTGPSQPGTATAGAGADDDASTRGMRESTTSAIRENGRTPSRSNTQPLSPAMNGNAEQLRSPEPPASPIPEIRISEHSEKSPPSKFSQLPSEEPASATEENEAAKAVAEAQKSDMAAEAPGVGKPPTSHLSEAHDAADDEAAKEAVGGDTALDAARGDADGAAEQEPQTASSGSFTNKRLCERWLDNLFMVLYEVRIARCGNLRI
jgi:hypothetical protein